MAKPIEKFRAGQISCAVLGNGVMGDGWWVGVMTATVTHTLRTNLDQFVP